ncbi:MAG: hypothetical protein ABEI13_04025 [Candidatus Paceibacteria bacterium]
MHKLTPIIFVVILLTIAGCTGNTDPNAGQLVINNDGVNEHTVTIKWRNNSTTLTVPSSDNRVLTIADSPGNYSIQATIDGQTQLNYSINYYPSGPSGQEPGGPVIQLYIENGTSYFSQSYDD